MLGWSQRVEARVESAGGKRLVMDLARACWLQIHSGNAWERRVRERGAVGVDVEERKTGGLLRTGTGSSVTATESGERETAPCLSLSPTSPLRATGSKP